MRRYLGLGMLLISSIRRFFRLNLMVIGVLVVKLGIIRRLKIKLGIQRYPIYEIIFHLHFLRHSHQFLIYIYIHIYTIDKIAQSNY